MLTDTQREQLDVVLVSPRNPLNIGAAARAMANFGFSRLTVAAPYEPNWREARSAIGAPQLLANAQEALTLGSAISNCTLVAGTGTLIHRKPEQPVVSLPALAPLVSREIARGGRIALVFGPEKHGLTRDDLSYCHILVEIPTHPQQPSMNLGQAVAVCLYELASRSTPPPLAESTPASIPARQLESLAALIEQTMEAAAYSPRMMQAANRHDVRLILRRLNPSAADVRRMLGLFRRILWRLDRPAPPSR